MRMMKQLAFLIARPVVDFESQFLGAKHFVCMPVAHCGRDVPFSKSFVVLTLQLLRFIGGDATIKCCGEANFDYVEALDKSYPVPIQSDTTSV